MQFPTLVLDSSPSTNAALLAMPEAPDYQVVTTLDQTAGRGRLGRTWTAPAGTALAVSVLLPGPPSGWLPLLAGAAMAEALTPLVPGGVALKWPNDILIGDKKVCGILAEVAGDGRVVLGAGVNLTMTADQLPVPTATSLTLEGADSAGLAETVLDAYLSRLLVTDAVPDRVRALCSTIGRQVRVELSGGGDLLGEAIGIDDDGRLQVRDHGGVTHAIGAGDVHHLRETIAG
jgi:BirA family biotin operon repressor/biotin-[acetyl-CoA-carboxylase] ligase